MLMAWSNVPICNYCWHLKEGTRFPVRLRNRKKEICHYCDEWTRSGIYVRVEVNTD